MEEDRVRGRRELGGADEEHEHEGVADGEGPFEAGGAQRVREPGASEESQRESREEGAPHRHAEGIEGDGLDEEAAGAPEDGGGEDGDDALALEGERGKAGAKGGHPRSLQAAPRGSHAGAGQRGGDAFVPGPRRGGRT